jgi:hypothetical protein
MGLRFTHGSVEITVDRDSKLDGNIIAVLLLQEFKCRQTNSSGGFHFNVLIIYRLLNFQLQTREYHPSDLTIQDNYIANC